MADPAVALLIRCCASDYQDAILLFDSLQSMPCNVFLLYSGEQAPSIIPRRITERLILMDVDVLKRAGLWSSNVSFKQLTWQCGDLALYTASDRIANADRLWMIEPDVYVAPAVLRRLMSMPFPGDFYAPLFERQLPRWFWYPAAGAYFPEVWGCMFCVVGIRQSVLPGLRQARAEIIRKWTAGSLPAPYLPNDEGFVCSFLQTNGARCADLNHLAKVYTTQTISFGMPRSRKTLDLQGGPSELIHHPVYTGAAFARKVQQRTRGHGLWYATAFDMLVEKDVLPIAPGVNQLVAAAYLVFFQPRAALERVLVKVRGARRRLRALMSRLCVRRESAGP